VALGLHNLASRLTGGRVLQGEDVIVAGLAYDSRAVAPGDAFFCYPGGVTDGHLYIAQAVEAGASSVIAEKTAAVPAGLPAVIVPDARLALAEAADVFYGHASGELTTIGVTGTKGKTTTTHLIRSVLEATGRSCGLVGTVHNVVAGREEPIRRTTPESVDLQALLRRMVDAGDLAVVVEVSSHALSLRRVHRIAFDVGVFTNLGHDHLDFHQTVEGYREAKGRLFRTLAPDATAVINADDGAGSFFVDAASCRVVSYGLRAEADVRAIGVAVRPQGASYLAVTPAGEVRIELKLTGLFNVYNSLAALATGLALGVDLGRIKVGLEATQGVPGRFETVQAGQGFTIFVDYAHTAESLENALRTARAFTDGKVITAFGCGGDRDRSKRPFMGRVAAQFADLVILTSDNPRTEDPEAIIRDIIPGVLEAGRGSEGYVVELDRAKAIEIAVSRARPGDVLILAGKGHETYQDFGHRVIHFDDREVARSAVLKMLAGQGQPQTRLDLDATAPVPKS
jgi:UDP-N-acetylmuramoyl-L-alanyl-D-glutamate--2,6-diaminopimelate ligase